MKKLTCFLLALVFMLSCLTVSASALTPEDIVVNDNLDNSTFTTDYLTSLSWEELSEEVFNLIVNSKEDEFVINVVLSLLSPQKVENKEYYHFGMAIVDMDFNRVMSKSIAIAFIFNAYNTGDKMDVVPWSSDSSIFFTSFNSGNLSYPVQEVGQYATVAPNTTYWETSANYGSGSKGAVDGDNPYILPYRLVYVDGVSYLDEEGNIEKACFLKGTEIDTEKASMVHIISGTGVELGWIAYDEVFRLGE